MSSPKGDTLPGDVAVRVKEPEVPTAKKEEAPKPVPTSTPVSSTDKPKISSNELKELKKSEKAARRAKVLEQKAQVGTPAAGAGGTSSQPGGASVKKEGKPRHDDKQKNGLNKEPARSNGKSQSSPEAKNQETGVSHQDITSSAAVYTIATAPLDLSHMPQPKEQTVEELKKIYLNVRTIGLQMLDYRIIGSNARMVAMLIVFKGIIKHYKAPENQALTRHLIPQVLSPQITHLSSCRPLSISQGNAIRWLKLKISQIDVILPEEEAKEFLCISIDEFIRDKSTLAHEVIANTAVEKIVDGDVILTYARSNVVEKTLKKAWLDGKKFSLIIIDSSPLHEGKQLAESLLADKDVNKILADRKNGLKITIGHYSAVSNLIDKATKLFLGASAMMSNGYLYSRSGTFGVALEGSTERKPVIVLCESVKFCSKAPLTTYDFNELAPNKEPLWEALDDPYMDDSEKEAIVSKFVDETAHRRVLGPWEFEKFMSKGGPGNGPGTLMAFNPMYDLTPSKYIDIVISEHGRVPPGAVQLLHKRYNEDNEVQ